MLLNYKGKWNSVKNQPQLADGIGTTNDAYLIFQNPSLPDGNLIDQRDLGAGLKSWICGEFMYYDGTEWQMVAGGGGGGGGSVTLINTTAPVTGGPITSTGSIGMPVANAGQDGYLSAFDWTNFNSKVPSSRQLTINGTTYDLSADRSWTVSGSPTGSAGGDLGGTYPNPTVEQIKGKAIATLAAGLLRYNGTSWVFDTSSYIVLTSLSGVSPITYNNTTGDIGIQVANVSQDGYLSSTDWSTFNAKVSAGSITTSGLTQNTNKLLGRSTAGAGAIEEISLGTGLAFSGSTLNATTVGGITALTGDVTASGSGSVPATIANDAVTYDKMADEGKLAMIGMLRFISGN